MEYLKTHTRKETCQVFKISETCIKEWTKLQNETGSFDRRPHNKAITRFPSDKLAKFVKENPLASLDEIAAHFGGARSGAGDALKRIKVTQKKRLLDMLKEMKEKEPSLTLNLHKLMRKLQ